MTEVSTYTIDTIEFIMAQSLSSSGIPTGCSVRPHQESRCDSSGRISEVLDFVGFQRPTQDRVVAVQKPLIEHLVTTRDTAPFEVVGLKTVDPWEA
jgi:hypothetical protein